MEHKQEVKEASARLREMAKSQQEEFPEVAEFHDQVAEYLEELTALLDAHAMYRKTLRFEAAKTILASLMDGKTTNRVVTAIHYADELLKELDK